MRRQLYYAEQNGDAVEVVADDEGVEITSWPLDDPDDVGAVYIPADRLRGVTISLLEEAGLSHVPVGPL